MKPQPLATVPPHPPLLGRDPPALVRFVGFVRFVRFGRDPPALLQLAELGQAVMSPTVLSPAVQVAARGHHQWWRAHTAATPHSHSGVEGVGGGTPS
jgi:hypothetical protein